jgi:uncharacterized protein (DUF2252 family)
MLMIDSNRSIAEYNAAREPERLAMKFKLMRANAFSFFRGSCHLFYERLAAVTVAPTPLVWVCGDLHLSNFGTYKGDNRLSYFDVNDFDEACLLPAGLELVRLLASIWVAELSQQIAGFDAVRLSDCLIAAYTAALTKGNAYWIEREIATGLVQGLLEKVASRKRADFLDSRTVPKGKRREIMSDGHKALPANDGQITTVRAFMDGFAANQPNPDFFEVIDIARRIAGTGSLGVDRYIILVHGKGSPDGNYLLDLKQAVPAAAVRYYPAVQPVWSSEADRVVAAQTRFQAVSQAFLRAVTVNGQPFVLRGLQPSEDKLDLAKAHGDHHLLEKVLVNMGQIVAWGQLRSGGRNGSAIADELIEFGRRSDWQGQLLQISRDCAVQAQADWASFAAAYDDGYFRKS